MSISNAFHFKFRERKFSYVTFLPPAEEGRISKKEKQKIEKEKEKQAKAVAN